MTNKWLLAMAFSLIAFFVHGQNVPQWKWTRDIISSGTTSTSASYGVTTDKNNNVFVAGYFQSSVSLGGTTLTSAGGNDALLVKYDPLGNVVWSVKGGGTGMDNATSIAVDSLGNSYLAGFYSSSSINFSGQTATNPTSSFSQVFLAKYDSSGNIVWLRTCGGAGNDYVEGISIDVAGNIYLAGSFQQTATFGSFTAISAGLQDAFLVKYDMNGTVQWLRTPGSVALDNGYGVSCDANGGVQFAGFFSDTAYFGNQPLISAGGYDIFWAKYDTAGNLLQLHRAGGAAADYCYDIITHPSGDIHLTGGFGGTVIVGNDTLVASGFNDAFLMRCDPAGDPVTTVQFGGSGADFGYGLARLSSYDVVVSGYYDGTFTAGNTSFSTAGSRDVFVAQFDFDCLNKWAIHAGGTGNDMSYSVATDQDDAICFSGVYANQAVFGNDTLNCGTRIAIFVSKLKSCDAISVTGPQGFCISNGATSLSFIASSSNQNYIYSWSPLGITGNSITVSPVTSTEYTVTADDGGGCVLNSSTSAIVESPAGFSLVAADDTICVGTAANLFAVWDWNSTLPEPNGYCSITSGSNADEQITAVEFSTMKNIQNDTCGSNYTDYTSIISPIKLNRGRSYPFSVTTDECDGAPYYNSGLRIFIDFNRDGDWNDSSEIAYSASSLTLSPNTRTGIVTIPSWASIGLTRMRVVVQENILFPNNCGTVNYGEAEDYLLEISTGGFVNSWSGDTSTNSWLSVFPSTTSTYSVTSTSEFGCVATASSTITVNPNPVATISGAPTVCVPSSFTLDGGAGFSSYEWTSNGFLLDTTQLLTDSAGNAWTLGDYVLRVIDANGCSATDTFTVTYSARPDDVPICLVTVDSASNYNAIIWEKNPIVDAIDSFIVYREVTTNTFQQIGAVPRSSMSVFVDNTVNVNATNYKYKIAWRDTCGNFSTQSLYHNTIHLQYLGFGNLQWTSYGIENTANIVSSYNVYRDDFSTGNFQLLQVIPGSNNTYTDVNYTSFPNCQYRVDVNWINPINCNPTARGIQTSQSNIRRIGIVGIEDVVLKNVSVYPNPAHDELTIRCNESFDRSSISYELLDALGRKISSGKLVASSTTVDLRAISGEGVYQLRWKDAAGNDLGGRRIVIVR
jgi:hypothetical protein